MSGTRSIARNTGILGAARLTERVGNLLIAFFISRRGGVAALGTYATAMAYFQLIATAGEMGWTNLLVREISKDRSRTNDFLVHAGMMAGALSVAAMTLAWIVIPHLGYSAELRLGLIVAVLAILPGVLNTLQEAVFVAHQRVEFQTVTTLAGTFLTVVLSWLLLARGHGVVSLLLAFVVIEYVVTLVYFVVIHRWVAPIRLRPDSSVRRKLLRELRPFAASSLLGALFARPELIIISLVATEREAGYYIAALKLVELWQFIPQVYMVNVFPVLSRSHSENDGRAPEIQARATTYLLAIGLPVSTGLLFGAERIITTLYGQSFAPSVVVLRILALNVVFYCMHSILWRVLAARGEQGRVLRVQVVSLVFRLGLGVALTMQLGATGAAVAMASGLGLHVVMLAIGVRRNGTPVGVTNSVRPFAVSAAGMGALVAVMSHSVTLPVVVGVAAVSYATGVLALGGFGWTFDGVARRFLPTPAGSRR
jgi:O-antigen/teichoic acid export membrane protein